MTIYIPKKIITLTPTREAPLFFLAGPIRGGGDWQHQMALELMLQCPKADIACPSRWTAKHPLAEHFFRPFSQAENRQLVWERYYMILAALRTQLRPSSPRPVPGCLMFWLPLESETEPHPGPEPYAMDTRRELGKYAALLEMLGARIVIGGDRRFFGLDVILNEFADASAQDSFPFYETMEDLVSAALFEARA